MPLNAKKTSYVCEDKRCLNTIYKMKREEPFSLRRPIRNSSLFNLSTRKNFIKLVTVIRNHPFFCMNLNDNYIILQFQYLTLEHPILY